MPENKKLSIVRPMHSHPIPFDQDEIDRLWEENPKWVSGEPPHVDEAHDKYTEEIAQYGDWRVFRSTWPFSHTSGVIMWHRGLGEGFRIDESEGEWHSFVNLMASVVEEEGDCREADYSDSLRQSGCYNQQCKECGQSWTVG